MSITLQRISLLIALAFAVCSLAVFPAAADDVILSNNSGSADAVFFIKGEPSLVMNGFDLTPVGVQLPTTLVAVGISVSEPVPGSYARLAVYQDANGGSPVDATILHQQYVSLGQIGVNRIVLDQPLLITEPVIWVGFYLPVDFRFHADRSGSSVLTYWAWTPGGSFDLASLASAEVLGPGDGSAPVEIAMDGIARITAELRTPDYNAIAAAFPLTEQLPAGAEQDISALQAYEGCDLLLHDPSDLNVNTALSFPLFCRVADAFEAPNQTYDPPGQNLAIDRAGPLYKLSTLLSPEQITPGLASQLPVRVTHCMRVPPTDIDRAVIAEVREHEARSERWYMLPTVRIQDVVCAEVSVAHYLSYFVARAPESAPNVNLVVGWSQVEPHPLQCGIKTMVYAPIVNTGQSWFSTTSGTVSVALEDFSVNTGISNARYVLQVSTDHFGPGDRRLYPLGPIIVDKDVNQLHRLEVRVDEANKVPEEFEADNIWFTEYVLAPFGEDEDDCADSEEIAEMERLEYEALLQREAAWQQWVEYWTETGFDYDLDGTTEFINVRDALGRKLERLCKDTDSVCKFMDVEDADPAEIRFQIRRSGV